MDALDETLECSNCGKMHSPLETFPGTLCLDCYSKLPEANAPLTAEGLADMWRNLA